MRYATLATISVVAYETAPEVIRQYVLDNMRRHAQRQTGSEVLAVVEVKTGREWITFYDGTSVEVVRIHVLWDTFKDPLCPCCRRDVESCEINGRCVDCRERRTFAEIAPQFLLCYDCAAIRAGADEIGDDE